MSQRLNSQLRIMPIRYRESLRQATNDRQLSGDRFPSYLKQYPEPIQAAIRQSMIGEIPTTLPPLSIETISFYRRDKRTIFVTSLPGTNQPDYHLLHESLWMLAAHEQHLFTNYSDIVSEFEEHLVDYLNCPYEEIRDKAVKVAGNKVIGSEEDVLTIANKDSKQAWVLVNNIFKGKIASQKLFPFLDTEEELVLDALALLCNQSRNVKGVKENDAVLDKLVALLDHYNENLRFKAVQIIGDLLAEPEAAEYAALLSKRQVLDRFFELMVSPNAELRKAVCWAISNYSFDRVFANEVFFHSKIMERLLIHFEKESSSAVLVEITYVFSHLVEFGDRRQAWKLTSERILTSCSDHMSRNDSNLTKNILNFLWILVRLGDEVGDGQCNEVLQMISGSKLRQQIAQKTFSTEDPETSEIALLFEESLDNMKCLS